MMGKTSLAERIQTALTERRKSSVMPMAATAVGAARTSASSVSDMRRFR